MLEEWTSFSDCICIYVCMYSINFPKYHMKMLLGDFNAKVGRENIFKPTTGQESLHQDSNDNGVRLVNFATSKTLVVKSTMFPHQNIHKYTWTSPDGKTHNQIDHILIDRRWHSSVLDVRSFRGVDCVTDHTSYTETCRSCFNVNFNANFNIVFLDNSLVHQLVTK